MQIYVYIFLKKYLEPCNECLLCALNIIVKLLRIMNWSLLEENSKYMMIFLNVSYFTMYLHIAQI